jgi:ribose transport system permease protein
MINFRKLLTGKNSRNGLWFIPLVLGCLGCIWLFVRTDDFQNKQNLLNLVAQATPLMIVSLGQMIVVLLRGLDLSVGAVISLTTAILALNGPAYVLLPAVFLAAALIGCVNGIAVTRWNVHPIIATLSIMGIVQGIAMLIRPVAGGTIPAAVIQLVNGEFLGVYMPLIWFALVVFMGWKIIHGSRYGLHLFAIGGGDVAHSFGIADKKNTVLAYMLCSMFAALAGTFLAGRIASGDPNIGSLFAIDSITAVALGGVQLAGGVGSLLGTLVGSSLLTLLANGMNLEGVSAFIQTAVKGIILLFVVALQPRKNIGL